MTTPPALSDRPVGEFLDALAAKTPTPGGGAVAGLTAAIGAAQARMVVAYSVGRKALAEHAPLHETVAGRLASMQADALALAAEDEAAYGALNALWTADKDDPARVAAVAAAIDVPRRAVELCVEMLDVLHSLLGASNRMLGSDLAIAALLAHAAARSAAWNVRINLPQLNDTAEREQTAAWLAETLERAAKRAAEIEERLMSSV